MRETVFKTRFQTRIGDRSSWIAIRGDTRAQQGGEIVDERYRPKIEKKFLKKISPKNPLNNTTANILSVYGKHP